MANPSSGVNQLEANQRVYNDEEIEERKGQVWGLLSE